MPFIFSTRLRGVCRGKMAGRGSYPLSSLLHRCHGRVLDVSVGHCWSSLEEARRGTY